MKKALILIVTMALLMSGVTAVAFETDYTIDNANLMRQYITHHASTAYAYDNNYFYGWDITKNTPNLTKWHVTGGDGVMLYKSTDYSKMPIHYQFSQGWVYYQLTNDNQQKLYRVRTSGKDNQTVISGNIEFFSVYGNRIYYVDANKNYALYQCDLDGKNKTCLVSEGCFYPVVLNEKQIAYQYDNGKTAYLTVMNLQTKKTETLSNVSCYAPIWDGKHIYYAAGATYYANDKDYSIKRTDGKTTETVVDVAVGMNFFIQDNYIYFNNMDDDGRIYRVNKSGKEFMQVTDDPAEVFFALAGTLTYVTVDDDGNTTGFEMCADFGGMKEDFCPWDW